MSQVQRKTENFTSDASVTSRQDEAASWFRFLRDQICSTFEQIERELSATEHRALPPGVFERKAWKRPSGDGGDDGGGGEMSVMRGRVFEKVGVNISTVHGLLSEDFRKQVPGAEQDGRFWASGISVVAHMRSPLVPAVHMNTRHIVTSKAWFGGGADLTPMLLERTETHEDRRQFHSALQTVCDRYQAGAYERFSKWCDDYFYLPHRQEPRGVGGIFFDWLQDDWEGDFTFVQQVGKSFLDVYGAIVRSRMNEVWSEAQREAQLVRRGRYVEFNLLYDRGTTFGLKTGGNTEAILMSLPPEVRWP